MLVSRRYFQGQNTNEYNDEGAHCKDIGKNERLFVFSRMSHVPIDVGKDTMTAPWSFA